MREERKERVLAIEVREQRLWYVWGVKGGFLGSRGKKWFKTGANRSGEGGRGKNRMKVMRIWV